MGTGLTGSDGGPPCGRGIINPSLKFKTKNVFCGIYRVIGSFIDPWNAGHSLQCSGTNQACMWHPNVTTS